VSPFIEIANGRLLAASVKTETTLTASPMSCNEIYLSSPVICFTWTCLPASAAAHFAGVRENRKACGGRPNDSRTRPRERRGSANPSCAKTEWRMTALLNH